MSESYNDNVANASEYIDNDNGGGKDKIRITEYTAALYEEFLNASYRSYSNAGFLSLACSKLQDFMYRWYVDLNEEERRYIVSKMTYKQYIASPYWQYVALVYRCRANFRCQRCGEERRSHLSIHHKTYAHIGSELHYPEDILVLCHTCHMHEHGKDGGKNA